MRRLIVSAVLLTACVAAAWPGAAAAQTGQAAAASPEDVARGFYAFYLGELNRDNWSPLKKRREALKYLTPEYHRRLPRLIEQQMVDLVICAQDWDQNWARTFTVSPARVRASTATTTVTLPPFGGGAGDSIKIKLTLVKRAGHWLINNTDCVL